MFISHSISFKVLKSLPLMLLLMWQPSFADNINHRELHAHHANRAYEHELLGIVEQLQNAQLEEALQAVDVHLQRFPKSRVGHLLRADILQAKSGQLSALGDTVLLPQDARDGLKHQLKNRWLHDHVYDRAAHSKVPDSLISLGSHPYVLVADLPAGRLYLYENQAGYPRLVRDYYMSVGSEGYGKQVEGDNKTPVGVYHVNQYIEGQRLPDLYGKGAFPVNYPNEYDRYRNRTGYGIWLHGTPSDTYARSPWSSEGCFVLSNDDLLDIGQYISPELKTPVVLSDGINWVDDDTLLARRSAFLEVVEQWRRDWESLDIQAMVDHYQRDEFNFGNGDYQQWLQRKRSVNQAKSFVQVNLEIESLFSYPGDSDMFIVHFRQQYLSNNYAGESLKLQYWRRDSQGKWRIVYES